MNILAEIRARFAQALQPLTSDPAPYLEMVRVAGNPQFGDFQANCAMPLAKEHKTNPREIAAKIVENLTLDDFCEPPEVAGPGFINIKLKDSFLQQQMQQLLADPRLGVEPQPKRNFVIDYSGPNVAKPMHVGHLRSTVIGDALYHTLKFLGHHVLGDNHIGDWGTQFGKIIYGYKHFADPNAIQSELVHELARLYRLVSQLEGYQEAVPGLPQLEQRAAYLNNEISQVNALPDNKETKKQLKQLNKKLEALQEERKSYEKKIREVESSQKLKQLSDQHPHIADKAREETAKLHNGDAENLALWHQFLPACRELLDEMYARLGIHFDMTKGESDYHDMLAGVVQDLESKGIARESKGAKCVFFEGKDVPFLIRKGDGAFTYATTDLATLKFRIEELKADSILYVVGLPQSEHFNMLFDTARMWGYTAAELKFVGFGSVLDENRQIYRTRAGDTVGLESLIDEAINRARLIVEANDEGKPDGPELDPETRRKIAEAVGIGGIKFADLMHNRESDYVFDWDKMLSTTGDTATYIQYTYARCHGIFRRGGVDREELVKSNSPILISAPEERALMRHITRLPEVLAEVVVDYRPNLLTDYLLDLCKTYSKFFDQCPVLKAETPELKASRLLLCELTARTTSLGLSLLGIQTCERM